MPVIEKAAMVSPARPGRVSLPEVADGDPVSDFEGGRACSTVESCAADDVVTSEDPKDTVAAPPLSHLLRM
jgi:hypothetical protein